jgi:hypothetical protein
MKKGLEEPRRRRRRVVGVVARELEFEFSNFKYF